MVYQQEKHIRPGSRKSKPGGRTLEAGGNNTIFFIGLHVLHRSIRLLVEFGIGHRLVEGMFQWASDLVNARRADNAVPQDQTELEGLQFAFLEALWFHESCGGVYGFGPRNSERENVGEAKDLGDEKVQ
ncbi:hypothetical protein F2Q68_00016172 [Brassica cretica]|uniref:Uncharacterized protein n=1 Tax=Brassica cretica TaxID=69181 RepID=A0A8S9HAD5_BRACR|nr:hypothetical protein F2Q68_00016172 [Brassica cretica]